MNLYVVTDPAKPHVVLYSATTLADVASALAAQAHPERLEVHKHRDGFSAPLDATDRAALAALVD
jgi:hypothetical protein